jgi:dihydrolipoamide dehydrogenase
VTVVEMMPTLIPLEEEELGIRLSKSLSSRGIRIMVGTTVKEFRKKSVIEALTVSKSGEEQIVESEKVLLAAGRAPNLDDLGLESAGVTYSRRGVFVDEYMETNVKGVFAIGDCVTVSLAHVASEQGIVAAENALGHRSIYDSRIIPRCIFTMPEVAAVGMTSKEAKDHGYELLTGRFPFSASGRALTLGETEGTVKIIAEKSTKKILGFHIIGNRASELIPEATLAIKMQAKLSDLGGLIHPHPTLSEGLKEAALEAEGVALDLAAKKRLV